MCCSSCLQYVANVQLCRDVRIIKRDIVFTGCEMCCSVLMERPFQDVVKTCELEDQLHERDVELTESRLQSLASSHRIEQLQERITDLEVSTIQEHFCTPCSSYSYSSNI